MQYSRPVKVTYTVPGPRLLICGAWKLSHVDHVADRDRVSDCQVQRAKMSAPGADMICGRPSSCRAYETLQTTSDDADLWPALIIGASVTPGPWNVHTNFGFSETFLFSSSNRAGGAYSAPRPPKLVGRVSLSPPTQEKPLPAGISALRTLGVHLQDPVVTVL